MKRTVIAVAVVLALGMAVMGYAPLPRPTTIVVQHKFLNQTAAILPTALFTPHSDNDFRLNVYIAVPDCEGGNGGGDVELADMWNDGVASNSYFPADAHCTTNGGTAFGEASQVIHAAAGDTISFSTVDDNGSSYNLYITLERL